MINRITLIGRLTDDPELRYTGDGTPVCNFTLAVERNYKNREGEKEVDFIKQVAWNKLAEIAAENLGKGRLIGTSGRLQIRKSKKDNRTYVNPEVVIDELQFLDFKDDKPKAEKYEADDFDDFLG